MTLDPRDDDMPDGAPPPTPTPMLLDRLSDASIAVAVAALLGLVVVQGWQVFARYVLNDSPSWTEPVTLALLTVTLRLTGENV